MWQHQKTKQFCKIAFEHGKWSVDLTASYQCVLWFCRLGEYGACHEIGRTKCRTCHAKSSQRRGLLTSRMDMSLVLRVPREMHLCRSSSTVPRLPSFLECCKNPHVWLPFDKVQNPLPERPKVDWTWCAFHMFNLSTSTSAPKLWYFYHFHFQTCFAPQRRALSEQLNFQKCSENEVFWSLYFEMCFAPHQRALFRHPHFQKCYDVSHPTRRIRTRRFSEPTSPAALNNGKTPCFATLPSRAPASSFFFLFSDLLSSPLLYFDSSRLCFFICPYCRKFDF